MSEASRVIARENFRANLTATLVTSMLRTQAVNRVCAVVTDAGVRSTG